MALSDRIRGCLNRVAEAERLAANEPDAAAKAELLALASRWRTLADDYEYVENLECFLKSSMPHHRSMRKN